MRATYGTPRGLTSSGRLPLANHRVGIPQWCNERSSTPHEGSGMQTRLCGRETHLVPWCLRRSALLALILALGAAEAQAQTGTVLGQVTDQASRRPVTGA